MVSKKRPRMILFPTLDYLSRYQQEKKLKEIAGKVVRYNMYDDIKNLPSLEALEKMDKEKAKNIVAIARDKHTVVALRAHWQISTHALYKKVFPYYDIEVNRDKPKSTEGVSQNVKAPTLTVSGVSNISVEPTGFQIALEGSFLGDELSERILRLDALINKDSKYHIKLVLSEQ